MVYQKERVQGVIILLENETHIRKTFVNQFEDLSINLNLIECSTPDEYEIALIISKKNNDLRGIIMDLSNTTEEEDTKKYKASTYIRQEFEINRIPIFIHSGNLDYFKGLNDKGTVFKIPKSSNSIESICKSIKKMNHSGFLNIFCLGGNLEKRIMAEIHDAFVEQFKGNEIEKIIDSIIHSSPENLTSRTNEVFERIAIRAVYKNWVSAKKVDGKLEEIKFNTIEHYYRRTSDFEIWTGDIFKSKTNEDVVVVLTPRCNVGHENYDQLLLCKLLDLKGNVLEQILSKKRGEKNLKKNITDDVTLTGERYRFLPQTPQFKGGVVDYKTLFTLKKDTFLNQYYQLISLSDELTNDVVRKLNSYLLRGGISETEFREAHYYVSSSIKVEERKVQP